MKATEELQHELYAKLVNALLDMLKRTDPSELKASTLEVARKVCNDAGVSQKVREAQERRNLESLQGEPDLEVPFPIPELEQ